MIIPGTSATSPDDGATSCTLSHAQLCHLSQSHPPSGHLHIFTLKHLYRIHPQLEINMIIILGSRCGDSDLTLGLTGSTVWEPGNPRKCSSATSSFEHSPPQPSSSSPAAPPPHQVLLSKLAALSQRNACLLSVAIFCQVPFPHLQSTMLHSSLLTAKLLNTMFSKAGVPIAAGIAI